MRVDRAMKGKDDEKIKIRKLLGLPPLSSY